MVTDVEKTIFELVGKYNGRSWLTFRIPTLTIDSSLNHMMKIDEEEAYDLLDKIFTRFNIDNAGFDFSYYFSRENKATKPLTINMLIESAKSERWLYD